MSNFYRGAADSRQQRLQSTAELIAARRGLAMPAVDKGVESVVLPAAEGTSFDDSARASRQQTPRHSLRDRLDEMRTGSSGKVLRWGAKQIIGCTLIVEGSMGVGYATPPLLVEIVAQTPVVSSLSPVPPSEILPNAAHNFVTGLEIIPEEIWRSLV